MSTKILIVCDNFSQREKYSAFLSEKYELVEADCADKVISVINQNINLISAVLIDLSVSLTYDFEALTIIRNDSEWNRIPVIVITPQNDPDCMNKALSFGANNVIPGSCDLKMIENTMLNQIRLCQAAASSTKINSDKLTGIMTRDCFVDAISRMVSCHEPGYYIVSFVNINNFKIINDQYGLDNGDKVLCHIAHCMKECTDKIGGISCRISADNFAAIYPSEYADSDIIKNYHRITMRPEFISSMVHIRIGRYKADDTLLSPLGMIDRAAMAAKTINGRYDIYIALYNISMRSELIHEQQIINDMHDALSQGMFEPWFQPQYDHSSGSMIGAEALVRWKKGNSYISPADFVPVFERNGFIYEMDKYIWDRTCQIMRRWIDEGRHPLPVSVNISRCDILHDDFIEVIKSIISKYNLPYDMLRLEITESAFSESTDQIVSKAVQLINSGFTVEIDDFGSGFSSLNTLKDVPASILKLDMKFFERTGNSQRSGNIIESVVRMAKWLGMVVIAEGVEEIEEADFLKSIGCYYIQGYFYARPMPVHEYEKHFGECNKQCDLIRLKSLETFDNSQFWDPHSIETFIFNNYAGATCIFEYTNDRLELLRVNEQFEKALGFFGPLESPGSGMNLNRQLSDENRKKLIDNIQACITQKKLCSSEFVLSDKRHSEFLRISTREIARAGDRHLIYGSIVNITEQRHISDHLHIVLNYFNSGIIAVSLDKCKPKCLFSNQMFYNLTGCSEDMYSDSVDGEFISLVHPDDREYVKSAFIQTNSPDKSAEIEYRVVRPDTKTIWIKTVITVIEQSNVPVQISVFSDITGEKKINEQVKNLKESIQLLINNTNGGFCRIRMFNSSYPEILFVDDSLCRIIGMTKDEMKNGHRYNALRFIDPDDITQLSEHTMDAIRSDGMITAKCRVQCKNGNYIMVTIFGRFMKDKSGHLFLNAYLNTIPWNNNHIIGKKPENHIWQ